MNSLYFGNIEQLLINCQHYEVPSKDGKGNGASTLKYVKNVIPC